MQSRKASSPNHGGSNKSRDTFAIENVVACVCQLKMKGPFHATPSKQRCHFPLMIKGRAIYENDCIIPTCPLVIMGHISTLWELSEYVEPFFPCFYISCLVQTKRWKRNREKGGDYVFLPTHEIKQLFTQPLLQSKDVEIDACEEKSRLRQCWGFLKSMNMFQVKDQSSHDKVMIWGENMGIRDTTALKWNILMSTGSKWKWNVVFMAMRSTMCWEKYMAVYCENLSNGRDHLNLESWKLI